MSKVETDVNEEVVQDDAEQDNTEALIREAFDASIAEESEEDKVKMDMIQAGATFKNVTRLYNQFMIDAGLAISKADRAQIIEDTLEGREFEVEADFESAVNDVVEAVKGATERSAAALVRSYCKKNELECYAKPKGTGTARVSFASKFYEFLIGNPAVSKEDATAYIMGTGDHEDTSENVQKNQTHYLSIWQLVNTITTK